jgi:hypothetical protein
MFIALSKTAQSGNRLNPPEGVSLSLVVAMLLCVFCAMR